MEPLFIYPEYEVIRDEARCIACRVCERQCANEVHYYDERLGRMLAESDACVNCAVINPMQSVYLRYFRFDEERAMQTDINFAALQEEPVDVMLEHAPASLSYTEKRFPPRGSMIEKEGFTMACLIPGILKTADIPDLCKMAGGIIQNIAPV